ncbi:MAG TPA: hypothetical protein VIJ18_11225 [Microbacteriaceae bacterium]
MATTIPFTPMPVSQVDVAYEYGPDSVPRSGVVAGSIEQLILSESLRFPGTSRKIWIHVPAGLSSSEESAVMFFNDGWW